MTALEEHCYYGMVVGKCVGDIVKPIDKVFSTPNYLLAHVIHI